jgi:hypothetical protein
MTIGFITKGMLMATLVYAGATAWGGEIEILSEGWPLNLSPPTSKTVEQTQGVPRANPIPDQSSRLLREPPTITGEIRVGDQTLIPYLGAGFGGGYATEQDRMLGSDPTLQQKNILGNGNGSGYLPNEFQMGLRIPF